MSRRSDVWSHFTRINNKYAMCNVCTVSISYKNSITNLKRHVQRKHPGEYPQTPPPMVSIQEERGSALEGNDFSPSVQMSAEGPVLIDSRYACKSKIWMYFTKTDKAVALCNICMQPRSFRSTISNLKRHLHRKHKVIYDQYLTFDKDGSLDDLGSVQDDEDDDTLEETDPIPSPSRPDTRASAEIPAKRQKFTDSGNITPAQKELIDRDLLDLFIKDLQPLSVVEDVGFSKLMNWIPGYDLPDGDTISSVMIPDLYRELFESTKETVSREAETVCITADSWTSCADESYIAITGHYITRDFDFRSVLLKCFGFAGDDTATSLAKEIGNVIAEWNLQNKVNFAVSDNESNIRDAIEDILKWKHYSCFGHKLNSIVQQSLCELQNTLNKVRKIARHFDRSSAAIENLVKQEPPSAIENLVKQEQPSASPPRAKRIVRDAACGWSSTFHTLRRLVELEEAVKASTESIGEDLPAMTSGEWQTCRELVEILSPFEEMTDSMSDREYMTGSSVIVVTNCLQGACEKLERLDYSPAARNVIAALKRGIGETLGNVESDGTFSLCTLLDPRYKYHVFQDHAALENAKTNLQSLVAEAIGKNTEIKTEHPQKGSAASTAPPPAGNISAWSILSDMIDKRRQTTTLPNTMKEIDRYFKYDILPRLNENGEQNCPLAWWKELEHVLPNLAKLFRERCNIVATSVPCERVFSKTRHLISDRRARLTSKDNVEMIMFLNGNSKLRNS